MPGLSSLLDLLPDSAPTPVRREVKVGRNDPCPIAVGLDRGAPPLAQLLAANELAGAFGIAPGTADNIRQQVLETCSAWWDRFRAAKVPEIDVTRLSGSIDQRMIRLTA